MKGNTMRRSRWAAFAALLVALTLALLLAGWTWDDASATPNHPTMTVTATTVGNEFTATGCGYRWPGYDIYVYLYRVGPTGDELILYQSGTITSDGCFTVSPGYTFTQPGTYSAYSFQTKDVPGSYNHNHPLVDLDFTIS